LFLGELELADADLALRLAPLVRELAYRAR
jgi:hypothetical protein